MARSDGLPAAEYAAMKRQARENEGLQRSIIEGQMRDEGVDPSTGQRTSKASTSSSSSGGSRSAPRPFFVPQAVHSFTTGSTGGTVAGALLGALAFFTGRSYIEGGWSGVRAFYAAKFLNRTSSNPNPIPTTATTPTTLPVNNAANGSGAASSPTTSSGSSLGAGQTPSGAPATVGSRVKAGV